ncbi:MAG TPA: alpha/beta hydrolase, partial [Gemmatimonadaceae bacterium]|nr:alpha/beta hydrolase [Gemmatimonadaceae bacterium]
MRGAECAEGSATQVRSSDGTLIAYERCGSGPPVILVDGALCSRAFGPMPKLAPLLAGHFTVFTYDRRGRNDSGDTPPYAVDREVEDLDALIDEAGGSALVCGISSGGALALRAAASGSRITRLAVYEPPFMVGEGGHRPPADHEAQLARLASAGRRADAVKYFMTRVVGMPALLTLPMRLMPMWSKLEAVAHTLAYDAAVMGDYSLPTERAASVTVPTLVIAGAGSPEVLR